MTIDCLFFPNLFPPPFSFQVLFIYSPPSQVPEELVKPSSAGRTEGAKSPLQHAGADRDRICIEEWFLPLQTRHMNSL